MSARNTLTAARHIVVEGPIGAGKTSLARRLGAHIDAQMLLEQPELNPFLSRFYQDQQRLCPADAVVLSCFSASTSYASCRKPISHPPGGRRLPARKGSAVCAADAQ
jgi:hypothetical protein